MVNRAAIMLRYKQPFIDWINTSDPYNDDPGITLEDTNEERTVYLISESDADDYQKWIGKNYKELFESEIESWYADEDLWPKKITKKLFAEWVKVECHTVLIDTVGGEIYDDEVE